MPETPEVNCFFETVNARKGVYIEEEEEAEEAEDVDEEEAKAKDVDEEAEELEAEEELEEPEPEVELAKESESPPSITVAPSLDELCKLSLITFKWTQVTDFLLSHASR